MPECMECRRPIVDQTVARVGEAGMNFHEACLRCAVCRDQLSGSCFTKWGQLYCKPDFYRMFGPRCAACHTVFAEHDSVRAIGESKFHLACFSCSRCGQALDKGMQVGLDHLGHLLCEADYLAQQLQLEAETKPAVDGGPSAAQITNMSVSGSGDMIGVSLGDNDSGIDSEMSSDDAKKFSAMMEDMMDDKSFDDEAASPGGGGHSSSHNTSGDKSDQEDYDDDKKEGKDGKRRGPRTTIKAKQLEVLKTCFDQNPKPTRLMREQLAKETGLPMRVIQVWFQNKRSKQKRIHQLHFMNHHHHARMAFLPPSHRRILHPMAFPPNAIAFDFRPPFPPTGPQRLPPQHPVDFGPPGAEYGQPMGGYIPGPGPMGPPYGSVGMNDFMGGSGPIVSTAPMSHDPITTTLPYPSPPVGSMDFANNSGMNVNGASNNTTEPVMQDAAVANGSQTPVDVGLSGSGPEAISGASESADSSFPPDGCFPSPPLSDCSIPDYHIPAQQPIMC